MKRFYEMKEGGGFELSVAGFFFSKAN